MILYFKFLKNKLDIPSMSDPCLPHYRIKYNKLVTSHPYYHIISMSTLK